MNIDYTKMTAEEYIAALLKAMAEAGGVVHAVIGVQSPGDFEGTRHVLVHFEIEGVLTDEQLEQYKAEQELGGMHGTPDKTLIN